MLDHYVLIGQTPVVEPDFLAWARWYEAADRLVFRTNVPGGTLSTVFLGLDYSFWGGPPLLFETMLFLDGAGVEMFGRCSTWLEAEAQHAAAHQEVLAR